MEGDARMPRRIERYAKPVRIYFWPNVEADALVLEIWKEIPQGERPQDVFRRAMLLGLREMAAAGELPEKLLARNRIGERLARRLPPAFTAPAALPAPVQVPVPAPAPAYPAYAPEPARESAPIAFEEAVEAEPDIDAMLRMMGGEAPMTREDA